MRTPSPILVTGATGTVGRHVAPGMADGRADAVGVRALTEDGHRNTAYALTGDEALRYVEVADRFSEVLGRPIRYANPSVLDFVRHMCGQGHPWPFVLVMTGIYLTARFGLAATVTDNLEQVLERSATSVRTFIRDYRSYWERSD